MRDLHWPAPGDLQALGLSLLDTKAKPDFEDINGHVNVRHHYGLHMDAAEDALPKLFGMDARWVEDTGQSSFSIAHHVQFHAEVLTGNELSVFLSLLFNLGCAWVDACRSWFGVS